MRGSTASNFMEEIGDVAQMTSCFKFTPVIGTNKGPKRVVVTTSSNTLQDFGHMVVDVVAMAILFAFVLVSSFVLFFTVPQSWFGDVPRGCATTRDVYFGRGIDATLGQQWYGTGQHQSWQRFGRCKMGIQDIEFQIWKSLLSFFWWMQDLYSKISCRGSDSVNAPFSRNESLLVVDSEGWHIPESQKSMPEKMSWLLKLQYPWRIHGTNGIFTYMNGWFLW